MVDDASSDDTVDVVRKWGRQHSFPVDVEVLKKNAGPGAARNRGIERATTRYISFVDSDDEHLPDALQRLVQPLEVMPEAVLSFGDATVVTKDGRLPNGLFRPRIDLEGACEPVPHPGMELYRLKDAKKSLLKASIIPTSATCFRRDAALAVGGMPEAFRAGEDWLFWLRLTQIGTFVFQLHDVALHHRHEANLTSPRSAEFVGRQKVMGFASLLDGSAGVPLTYEERLHVSSLFHQQIEGWRFHLSNLGLRAYLSGLNSTKSVTGRSILAHVLRDPKCAARAAFTSLTPKTTA